MNVIPNLPDEESCVRILIAMKSLPCSLIAQIAQDGFFLVARAGSTIRDFLSCECGLSDEYIEKRVSTIFLDGSPVDNIDAALIRSGSIIALSAAMPGLVGAAMRRGGAYSILRSSITYSEQSESASAGVVLARLKLFNLVMQELGSSFLEKGVYLLCNDLARYLAGQSYDFWNECRNIVIDGKSVCCISLREGLFNFDCKMAQVIIDVQEIP